MNSAQNVVTLVSSRLAAKDTSSADADRDLPELIRSAKRIALKELDAAMTQMFNNADDCLFDYAEKADNNRQQTLYFDSMRELRLRKDSIRKHFFSHFEQTFMQAYREPESIVSCMNAQSNSPAQLSLVAEDDLEESLAITNMSQRIFSECREELSAMVVRLNEISELHTFSKEANPLAPEIICSSFQHATTCLTPIIEIKLIIFKLFDKYVVHNINYLYQDINAMFIAAGVLPTIKYHVPNHNHAPAGGAHKPSNPTGSTNDAYSDPDSTSYDNIRYALHEFQSNGDSNVRPIQGSQNYRSNQNYRHATNNHQDNNPYYYVNSDIIGGLSRLQANPDYTGLNSADETQSNSEYIKSNLIKNIVNYRGDQQARDLGRNESDLVDIVSMMFDYLLKDNHLHKRIKFCIARLQIPTIKVAMLDKTFFSKKSHPLRELLNELAITDSELFSTKKQNISLFEKIEYITESIIESFVENIELFEDLLIEFREFIESTQQADKQTKHNLLQTRKAVAAELQSRLQHHAVPEEISQFLLGPWKQVLQTVGIKNNASGDAWNLFTGFIDNLLWSITPKHNAEERAQLAQHIPVILMVIDEGFKRIKIDQGDTEKFTKQLEKLHLEALRTNLSETTDKEVGQIKQAPAEETITAIGINNHSSYRQDLSDPNLSISIYFDPVNRMPLNTWVEFSDKQIQRKGKLSWKSSFTGDYVFMSSTHNVVADLSMRELIQMFEDGSASLVDNVPILDKAIDSILNTLHSCVGNNKPKQSNLH